MHWFKQQILKTFRAAGYDLSRYRPSAHPDARRKRLMELAKIELVFDVGANDGQYASELRESGYKGRIISFEPLPAVFAVLAARAASDPNWMTCNYALGERAGEHTIFIAGNSYSSSLLKMLPAHEEAAPESKYIGEQQIVVKTLDEIYPELAGNATSVWLKADTQGFESKVIAGAVKSLPHINLVQLEISLTPLYDGALGILEMFSMMAGLGYSVVGIDPGFCHEQTGHLLQVDATFERVS